jgi:hypothetical protein
MPVLHQDIELTACQAWSQYFFDLIPGTRHPEPQQSDLGTRRMSGAK